MKKTSFASMNEGACAVVKKNSDVRNVLMIPSVKMFIVMPQYFMDVRI